MSRAFRCGTAKTLLNVKSMKSGANRAASKGLVLGMDIAIFFGIKPPVLDFHIIKSSGRREGIKRIFPEAEVI
jgi:hypothetical protein